jgi:hypothetical protein
MSLVSAACGGAPEAEPKSQERSQDLSLFRSYLALGDSIAFGFNPVDEVLDPQNIHAFVGYPELIALAPIPTSNAACPGETSGSFIDVSIPDNGCRAWRSLGGAMHVQYVNNAQSQLAFALSFLASHPGTATVSLGIGANELQLVEATCKAAFNPQDPNYAQEVAACELAQGPAAIAQVAQNIAIIAGTLRASGYSGQLALVTYNAIQYANQSDPAFLAIAGLDQAMVQVAQALPQLNLSLAKGFSSFGAIAALAGGDSCKAGLLYRLPDGTCDRHPSRFGASVYALAVAGAVPASSINLQASPPQFLASSVVDAALDDQAPAHDEHFRDGQVRLAGHLAVVLHPDALPV